MLVLFNVCFARPSNARFPKEFPHEETIRTKENPCLYGFRNAPTGIPVITSAVMSEKPPAAETVLDGDETTPTPPPAKPKPADVTEPAKPKPGTSTAKTPEMQAPPKRGGWTFFDEDNE